MCIPDGERNECGECSSIRYVEPNQSKHRREKGRTCQYVKKKTSQKYQKIVQTACDLSEQITQDHG